MTVEGSVDIGTGVAAQFIAGDLEGCARGVVRVTGSVPVRQEHMELWDWESGIGGHAGS